MIRTALTRSGRHDLFEAPERLTPVPLAHEQLSLLEPDQATQWVVWPDELERMLHGRQRRIELTICAERLPVIQIRRRQVRVLWAEQVCHDRDRRAQVFLAFSMAADREESHAEVRTLSGHP